MYRKKRSDLKRLKVKSIWPRVVELVIQAIIIFSFTGAAFVLAALGVCGTVFTDNITVSSKVLSIVNNEWNTRNESEIINRKLIKIQNETDKIGSICFIDDSTKIISTIGDSVPDLEEVFFDFDAYDKLSAKGLLGSDIYGETIIENSDDIFRNFPNIRNLFFFMNNIKDLEWESEDVLRLVQWVVYKSDIPDLNVCIQNFYYLNRFQIIFFGTFVLLFFFSLVFFWVYAIMRILIFVSECRTLNEIISIDPVTEGYNKEYFINKTNLYIKKRKKKACVVAIIRMEKYTNYCTAYGVKEGENLLEQFDEKLNSLIRRKERVAHYQNADFALFLFGNSNEEIVDRIHNMFDELNLVRKNQHTTFSAGICRVNTRTEDVSNLLTVARLAIPKNQNQADNIGWFNDTMKEEQVWERRIEDDMEKALEAHEFQVYLQPKYSTKNEVLSAAEALVRWIHPVLGFISPGKFIPIFERNGFILKLDDYMITEVARLQSQWLKEGKKLVPVSVNVSRAHFTCDDLADHICGIIDSFNVPHEFIELELTESAFFDDKEIILRTVNRLKEFGFKVSMDDFGAGYSSLNSLKELPLDVIKLDAEFFRGSDDFNRSNLIVSDTISLAKKLGMQIVAEGIETREQVDFLAKQNCDLIQGFYFAKPLPVKEFEEKAWGIS